MLKEEGSPDVWGRLRSDSKAPTGGCAAFKRGRNGLTRRAACQSEGECVQAGDVGSAGVGRARGWAIAEGGGVELGRALNAGRVLDCLGWLGRGRSGPAG